MASNAIQVDPDMREVVIHVELSRVFVLRIWLGVRLVRFGMWVIGGRCKVHMVA